MIRIYDENKVNDNLEYLDEVLETISKNSKDYVINIEKLVSHLNTIENPEKFFNKTLFEKISGFFKSAYSILENDAELVLPPEEFNSEESKLLNALTFLNSEGLIFYQAGYIRILFPGILKISQGGFYGEYKRRKWKDLFQKYFWIAGIGTFILGLITQLLIQKFMS